MGNRTKGLLSGIVIIFWMVAFAEAVLNFTLNLNDLEFRNAGFENKFGPRGMTCLTNDSETRRLRSSNIKSSVMLLANYPSTPLTSVPSKQLDEYVRATTRKLRHCVEVARGWSVIFFNLKYFDKLFSYFCISNHILNMHICIWSGVCSV